MTICDIIETFSYKSPSIYFTYDDINDEEFDFEESLKGDFSTELFSFAVHSESYIFSEGLGYPYFVIVKDGKEVYKDEFTPTEKEEAKCERYLYDDGDYECDFRDEDEEEEEDEQ